MPVVLLEILFVLCWSSGYITVEYALMGSEPFTILVVRYTLAAIALTLWCLWRREKLFCPPTVWLRAAVSGVLAHAVWLGALYIAQDNDVSPGTAALITALQPIVTALFAYRFARETIAIYQWIGILLGVAGVTLVIGEGLGLGDAPIWAYALPFLSVLAISVAFILERSSGRPDESSTVIGGSSRLVIQFTASAVLLLPFAAYEGFPLDPQPVVVLAFVWQIFILSIGSYGLMWLLVERTGPTRASSLMPLMPPVTLVASALLFSERLDGWKLAGFALSLLGVAMVRSSPAQMLNFLRRKHRI